jgi:hypothetical protein
MHPLDRSDRSSEDLVRRPGDNCGVRRRQDRESGQAMVEFALILFPLLLLVAGIIQFGIGLNYWLDMQRLANQGARWAVVNSYPGCPRTGPNTPCTPTLQQYLACQPQATAFKPAVMISFPAGATEDNVGDPVKVRLTTTFTVVPILGFGDLDLKAEATMRLEQDAGRFAANSTPVFCP